MNLQKLDSRIHAFRPDLADASLRGRVQAPRFATGERFHVTVPHAGLRAAPRDDAMQVTEALAGETVRVFDESADGWAWAQLAADGYVGWLRADALAAGAFTPTHRVTALSTFAFSRPDIKSPPLHSLPLGAFVAVSGEAEDRNARYALIEPAGAVVRQHLGEFHAAENDWASVAEWFIGTPYLWGGKTARGIDCSGLVQVALGACRIAAPRDSDMQEQLGDPLPPEARSGNLRRGDLVFWKGHVGIMLDPQRLLHANAFHMSVVAEPLEAVVERAGQRGSDVIALRRVNRALKLIDGLAAPER